MVSFNVFSEFLGIYSFKQNTSSGDTFLEPPFREICKSAGICMVEKWLANESMIQKAKCKVTTKL